MTEISDINDSRITPYKTLRYTPASHIDNNIFVAEGEKVTKKLLESKLGVISLFALPEFIEKYDRLIKRRIKDTDQIYTASIEFMNSIVGFKMHAGIMAIGRQPSYCPTDKLDDRIVVLNNIVDSENVGSIVRNCAAFGIGSIIFDSQGSSPYLRRAVRVSMGTIFDIKVHKAESLSDCIKILKNEHCYEILASEITDDAIDIINYSFPEKYALIFGNESHGIDTDILGLCDSTLYAPISDNVASINVAASSAVVLYQASKKPGIL